MKRGGQNFRSDAYPLEERLTVGVVSNALVFEEWFMFRSVEYVW